MGAQLSLQDTDPRRDLCTVTLPLGSSCTPQNENPLAEFPLPQGDGTREQARWQDPAGPEP